MCCGVPRDAVMLPVARGQAVGRGGAWTASAMMSEAPRRHGRPGPWAARGARDDGESGNGRVPRTRRGFTFHADATDGVAPGDMVVITATESVRVLGQVVDASWSRPVTTP